MNKEEAKKSIQNLIEKYERLSKENKINSYNEAQSRQKFIEPLFGFLGWNMHNIGIENDEVITENRENKGSLKRVDLAFCLNSIPVMCLETKSMKSDIDELRWAEQSINYSWNKNITWAVLTNFKKIKIFNAEIPPKDISQNLFIEIEYQDYIKSFDRLWLLSKDSFEKKLLEKEAEKWGKIKQRKPVSDKLSFDLMFWRILLTKDFKKLNNLNNEELDEGVQKILDRLIFIKTAEDRLIMPNCLLNILRSKKSNLYKQLITIFRDFDKIFNSKLFTVHNCETWEASDKALIEIIHGLYEKDYYKYDFSIISADVLGEMYEEYLSYVQGRKNIEEKQRHKKKSQGIYYTPKYIVDYIVKETLGKILQKTKLKDISKIKVLDPACGSGSFLMSACETLLNYIKKEEKYPSLLNQFNVLKENIFGVDLDPQAVEIAQLNLLLKVLSEKQKLPMLQHNISTGNSLVFGTSEKLQQHFGDNYLKLKPFDFENEFKEVFDQNGFDVIIGNPPYIFARGGNFDDKTKEYYYKNFPLANYQLNTYLLFIDRAFKLLKQGGYFGFIIPNTWLTIDTFVFLRKFLLTQTSDLQIINIFDRVFKNKANVDACLLIFKKGKPKNVKLGEFIEGQIKIIGTFPTSAFNKNNYIINMSLSKNKEPKLEIFKKITNNSQILENNYARISTGLKAYQEGKGKPKQTKEAKNNRIFHSKIENDKTYKKYLEGRDVSRYYLGWSGEFLSYGEWLAETRKSVSFNAPRILVRQIPSTPPYSINSVFTEEYLLNDINSMIVFDFKTNPLFILGVLNSKITTFWFINTFDKFQRKTFPQFKVKELKLFPVPNANEKEQEQIVKKVEMILNLNKELKKIPINTDKYNYLKKSIEKLDNELDNEIYNLYGLTDEEIKIIEEMDK